MKNWLKPAVLTIVCLLLLSLWALANEDALKESEKSLFSRDLIIPSPADLFVALEKMGEVDWNKAASYNTNSDYNNDYLRALNLGTRGADGFMAIHAEDKALLADMIRTIVKLAEELGASNTILDKRSRIEALARNEKWQELRMELDKLQSEVKLELIRQGDVDIAILLSAGGWINGLRATTKLLSSRYNRDDSAILFQPTLIYYFEAKFNELDKKALDQPVVRNIRDKIPEIKRLIDVGYDSPVPEENIKKLYTISSELVQAIEKG